ncbi:hypothetical protein HY493_00885 [Candidatus Woesearchaeota archaeon]|nr:hypothetical protein [Candidatus Woesearchaeota archaeon]
MTITYVESRKNARLTQYDDIKDVVIANAIKNVPEMKKEKRDTNRSLSEFS